MTAVESGVPVSINSHQEPALVKAARLGHWDVVERLAADGAALDAGDRFGYGAVDYAARTGSIYGLEMLKRRGASLSVTTYYGRQPIHSAALMNELAGVQWLAANGISLSTLTTPGRETPLHVAAFFGSFEVAAWLVDQPDVCVDARCACNFTPLYLADARHHDNIVALLLSRGARPIDSDDSDAETEQR